MQNLKTLPCLSVLELARLSERIDLAIEKHSLLKHPFYQKWSNGELSIEDLNVYAKEYFQLVRAVPEIVESIMESTTANDMIAENMAEERQHVELWKSFSASLGTSELGTGEEKTRASVRELEQLSQSSFVEGVAAMYAYEKEIPEISKRKIDGLKRFYGITSKGALEYFSTHEEADVRHAEVWRQILDSIKDERTQELAYEAALRSLKSQNKLLDAVMEKSAIAM
jgi:pyrroloquinoline-quinone synthase